MFFGNIPATTFWIAAMLLFLMVEAFTVGLVSMWFAVGALAAMVCAMLKVEIWIQIVVFLGVSALALCLTRPLAKKFINGRKQPTNADMNIGKECKVTEKIDNFSGTGAVYVDGKTWTARSENDEIIDEGESVCALRIEGVKLIVSRVNEEVTQ